MTTSRHGNRRNPKGVLEQRMSSPAPCLDAAMLHDKTNLKGSDTCSHILTAYLGSTSAPNRLKVIWQFFVFYPIPGNINNNFFKNIIGPDESSNHPDVCFSSIVRQSNSMSTDIDRRSPRPRRNQWSLRCGKLFPFSWLPSFYNQRTNEMQSSARTRFNRGSLPSIFDPCLVLTSSKKGDTYVARTLW